VRVAEEGGCHFADEVGVTGGCEFLVMAVLVSWCWYDDICVWESEVATVPSNVPTKEMEKRSRHLHMSILGRNLVILPALDEHGKRSCM
jgi:hypothetical protein